TIEPNDLVEAEGPVTAELVSQVAGSAPAPVTARGATATVPFGPQHVVSHVGTPRPEHVAYDTALLASWPSGLTDMLHETAGSRAIVYALLLDRDSEVRRQQLTYMSE